MYKCIKTSIGERYEYDGDFEKYLLDIGIESEHIEKMKKKILQKNLRIDFEEENKEIGLVPLSKVIGVQRGTAGKSVYENVRAMESNERDFHKFEECFGYVKKMSSLELMRKSYETLDTKDKPVKMIHYLEDDVYFVDGDGSHRTLTAMIVGAAFIKAKIYNVYSKNS